MTLDNGEGMAAMNAGQASKRRLDRSSVSNSVEIGLQIRLQRCSPAAFCGWFEPAAWPKPNKKAREEGGAPNNAKDENGVFR